GAGVPCREFPLPHIHLVLAARIEVVSPRKVESGLATPRGKLPFRLGWKPRLTPVTKGPGIIPGDVHHRVVIPPLQTRSGSFRLLPVRTIDPAPPRGSRHPLPACSHPFRQQPLEDERPAKALRLRHIPRFLHELPESRIGDRTGIDQER